MGEAVCASSPVSPEGVFFFETKIRPALVQHCFECHSADAKKLGGKLRLDNREAMLKGGESGPVLVPGNPGESLLLQALRHEDLEMPPESPLSEAPVQLFREWVSMGAPYPEGRTASPASPDRGGTGSGGLWSLHAVQDPAVPVPKTSNWARDPLDRFVLAEMEQE